MNTDKNKTFIGRGLPQIGADKSKKFEFKKLKINPLLSDFHLRQKQFVIIRASFASLRSAYFR